MKLRKNFQLQVSFSLREYFRIVLSALCRRTLAHALRLMLVIWRFTLHGRCFVIRCVSLSLLWSPHCSGILHAFCCSATAGSPYALSTSAVMFRRSAGAKPMCMRVRLGGEALNLGRSTRQVLGASIAKGGRLYRCGAQGALHGSSQSQKCRIDAVIISILMGMCGCERA
ncbi:hypothetical protein TRVL_07970 [Trypanosoma vivax]|nr:hypothetical protein TRVL_07970 [Trypanosoma vivax]